MRYLNEPTLHSNIYVKQLLTINTYDVCFRGWAILGIRFS